jgi:Chalcone isomerase-like
LSWTNGLVLIESVPSQFSPCEGIVPRDLRRFAALLLLGSWLCLPGGASARTAPAPQDDALPPAVIADVGPLRLLGRGQLRFLGFEIYRASMWVTDPGSPTGSTFALDLRYTRSFTREQLVTATLKELTRLGLGRPDQRERWRADLTAIFPDVRSGDRIVGVCFPGRETRFYSDGTLLGTLADPEFGPAFFGIWLDPRTRDPDVRARLLGSG